MKNIASIETIHTISPHPNADSLECAMVKGFQVVVKKDQYFHGQKVVYIWPDTISDAQEWNSFLNKSGNRGPIKFKSIKLRGQFSTGIVLPINVVPPEFASAENGTSVADILGVRKYIKDDGGAGASNGECGGEFPSEFISKTDEILAQSEPGIIEEFANHPVYGTLKIDGQSLTFVRWGEEISVSSRNRKIADSDNKFWNTARKYGLIEKTVGLNIAIQGEQYGPSIQKNPLAVKEISFAIFNIKNLDTGKYFSYSELVEFCDSKNLPMVPVLFVDSQFKGFDQYQQFVDALKYESNHVAEGIVIRPLQPQFSKILGKSLSVKFINRNYKD